MGDANDLSAGADGLLLDVHDHPGAALCDGAQALLPGDLLELKARLWPLLAALVSPERWWLWLGVFGLAWAYHAPAGLVGMLRTDPRPSTPSQTIPGEPP